MGKTHKRHGADKQMWLTCLSGRRGTVHPLCAPHCSAFAEVMLATTSVCSCTTFVSYTLRITEPRSPPCIDQKPSPRTQETVLWCLSSREPPPPSIPTSRPSRLKSILASLLNLHIFGCPFPLDQPHQTTRWTSITYILRRSSNTL